MEYQRWRRSSVQQATQETCGIGRKFRDSSDCEQLIVRTIQQCAFETLDSAEEGVGVIDRYRDVGRWKL